MTTVEMDHCREGPQLRDYCGGTTVGDTSVEGTTGSRTTVHEPL